MSGTKGHSGRHRESKTRGEVMRSLTLMLPGAVDVIQATAAGENKDRLRYEAAIEIKDSVLGKPRQQTDLDIKGGQEIGAGVVVQLFSLLQAKQKQLQSGAVPELPAGDIDKI